MQQVGSTPPWSSGSVPNPTDIMRTSSTPTETDPIIGTQTLLNREISQLKSMINVLPLWEETEVTRISKEEVVRNLQ